MFNYFPHRGRPSDRVASTWTRSCVRLDPTTTSVDDRTYLLDEELLNRSVLSKSSAQPTRHAQEEAAMSEEWDSIIIGGQSKQQLTERERSARQGH